MKIKWEQVTRQMVEDFCYKNSYERIRKGEQRVSDRCFQLTSLIFHLENKYCRSASKINNPAKLCQQINNLKSQLRQTRTYRQMMLEELKARTTPIESNTIRMAMKF